MDWHDDPHWEDAALDAVHRQTGGIPRRINTLCSRVLLLGTLEETHVVTAEMVDSTAAELREDLGGPAPPAPAGTMPASAAPASAVPNAAEYLLRRIQGVETGMARQERLFRRVIDLLGTYLEPQR